MKQTICQHQFTEAFKQCRPDNFSHQGLIALYDWFEELDADCGTETELDVIAICCDFSEYENLADFHESYDKDDYPDIESIQEYTNVIFSDHYTPTKCEHEFSFIIQDF